MLKGLTALLPKDTKASLKFKGKHLIMVILIVLGHKTEITIPCNFVC
jgi:hypothetical protein